MEDLSATDLNKNIKVTFYYTTELSRTVRFTHYGLLDKLTAIRVTNTLLAFYGMWQFITMFTGDKTGPQYEQDESGVPLTFMIHFNTVLPFTLKMTKWYLLGLLIKILYAFLTLPHKLHVVYSSCILLITKIYNSPLCSFHHSNSVTQKKRHKSKNNMLFFSE